ncbi:DUF1656 domain-containing protein [Stutzerimonas azotifigens]|uniref:DUF1656 domain-containing protein n=1 Tax=Stutzerimonas azotifigens TaxID=291995 RepID=UPI00042A9031|nr:DUF1656 domain-containing protein [Stutzerimonas azotifigens]
MSWHEWALGGVLVSPFLVAALVALLLTVGLRLLLRLTGLGRWIWHEALFDLALFVIVLGGVVAAMGRL